MMQSTQLLANSVLYWPDVDGKTYTERVLYVSQAEDVVAVIDLNDLMAWPKTRAYAEIESALGAGTAQLTGKDPFSKMLSLGLDGEDLSTGRQELYRRFLEARDKAWAVIAPLVAEGFPMGLLSRHGCSSTISERASAAGCTEKSVRKYLRRFWQRGQVRNALIPDFSRCGGKGQRRQPGSKKLGRPRAGYTGRNVEDRDIEIFRMATERFVVKEHMSLKQAYDKMWKTYYVEVPKTATLPAVPLPIGQVPSFEQFEYWYRKVFRSPDLVRKQEGEVAFGRKHRSKVRSSRAGVMGPGAMYIIDSTPADITLRGSRTPHVIGSPTLYFIIDLFSAMIVGFYIGLLNASVEAARLALFNAFRSKAEWYAEMGIDDFVPEDYPVQGMCQTLCHDGGELRSSLLEHVVGSLAVRTTQTPPFRPDLKGDIESLLNQVNRLLLRELPGNTVGRRERGDKDPRLEATLTIEEFREIVARWVVWHNCTYDIKQYPFGREMLRDGVAPTPLGLWRWGVENYGQLRYLPEDLIRLHLLPGGQASVTESGLLFNGLCYDSGKPEHDRWYEQARIWDRWKVDIAWDPNDVGVIYLRSKDTQSIERFPLSPRSAGYEGLTLAEYQAIHKAQKVEEAARHQEAVEQSAAFDHHVQQIVDNARERTDSQRLPGESKLAPVTDIRTYRAGEVQLEHKQNAWNDLGLSSSDTGGSRPEREIEPAVASAADEKLAMYARALEDSQDQ